MSEFRSRLTLMFGGDDDEHTVQQLQRRRGELRDYFLVERSGCRLQQLIIDTGFTLHVVLSDLARCDRAKWMRPYRGSLRYRGMTHRDRLREFSIEMIHYHDPIPSFLRLVESFDIAAGFSHSVAGRGLINSSVIIRQFLEIYLFESMLEIEYMARLLKSRENANLVNFRNRMKDNLIALETELAELELEEFDNFDDTLQVRHVAPPLYMDLRSSWMQRFEPDSRVLTEQQFLARRDELREYFLVKMSRLWPEDLFDDCSLLQPEVVFSICAPLPYGHWINRFSRFSPISKFIAACTLVNADGENHNVCDELVDLSGRIQQFSEIHLFVSLLEIEWMRKLLKPLCRENRDLVNFRCKMKNKLIGLENELAELELEFDKALFEESEERLLERLLQEDGDEIKWQLAAVHEPAPGEDIIKLSVRLPKGTVTSRLFHKSDKLQLLFDFIYVGSWIKPGSYTLVSRQVFSEEQSTSTLSELGLTRTEEFMFLVLK